MTIFKLLFFVSFMLITTANNLVAQNNALHFDGVNDHINGITGVNLANQSFTIEAWLKRGSTGTWDIAVGQGACGCNKSVYFGFHPGNTFAFAFYCNDTYTPAAYPDLNWHHWANTYNATTNTRKIYRDGVLVHTNTASADFQGTDNVFIGKQPCDDLPFHGTIDEVRIWNVERTQAEIQAAMNSELAGNEAGLVSYFRFNQGIAGGNNAGITTAIATTGSNGSLNNFTLNGATSNWVSGVTLVADDDGDGVGNENDNCPSTANANQADADGDGTGDACDGCPDDAGKTAPGQCGCGTADTDSDGDGVVNCNDLCPDDASKTAPGQCGCGNPDTDSDGDGVANCNDLCPDDASKTEPGQCGCGNPDTDGDGDGVANCNDLCPDDASKTAPGQCGCGNPDTDNDGDGVANCNDLCPDDASKTEPGQCGCGNPDKDNDGDGVANCHDLCPDDANKTEPSQCGCGNADTDNDGDAMADCVDADDDNDGCLDANDSNPLVYSADDDCDGVHNDCDVCPGGDDSGPCYASSFPGFGNIPPAWICGNNNNKVKICHNGNTLCISPNAVQAHLNHGDFLGPCTSCGGQNLVMPGGTGNVAAMAEQQELEIFPNPAASEASVHLHGFDPAAAAELTVLDVSGKIVWRQTLKEGQHHLTLDLSTGGFISGIYMVKANAGGQLLTKRLVVSK